MTATYNKNAKTKFTRFHRKENKCYFNGVYAMALIDNELRTIVDLRLYGTGATNTAAVWVHTPDLHTSGTGSAGGYGYNREAAAAQEAISNAGFQLSNQITGDSQIELALRAIANTLGYPTVYILKAHP